MPSSSLSSWVVAVLGWLVLSAACLLVLYYVVDLLVRLAGVSGWMVATIREVRARHGWRDSLSPWWLKALTCTNTPPDVLKPLFRGRRFDPAASSQEWMNDHLAKVADLEAQVRLLSQEASSERQMHGETAEAGAAVAALASELRAALHAEYSALTPRRDAPCQASLMQGRGNGRCECSECRRSRYLDLEARAEALGVNR